MALSKETVEKLRAIKAAILAEPELYDQNEFPDIARGHTCTSPCCYVGWAIWLNNPDENAYQELLESKGTFGTQELAEAIGISLRQASTLFSNWNPATKAPMVSAKEGAKRIDLFISSGGTE